MDGPLRQLFSALTPEAQASLRPVLDAHAVYLVSLDKISTEQIQAILDERASGPTKSSDPGIYLSRWQDLMDETTITPAATKGPPRMGRDVKGTTTEGKTGASAKGDRSGKTSREASPAPAVNVSAQVPPVADRELPLAPDTRLVVQNLGKGFRELVAEKAAMA